MKVLNLQCSAGHGFEGWFGSEDDYQSQHSRGLVACPLCADTRVSRLPSAPRLNLSAKPFQAAASATMGDAVSPKGEATEVMPAVVRADVRADMQAAMQAAWLQAVRHVMANTEDVGERFAEAARRIHYGEEPARGIRGQVSTQERLALREEGIETLALPVPAALKGPVQ
jgi:hypothetical protein